MYICNYMYADNIDHRSQTFSIILTSLLPSGQDGYDISRLEPGLEELKSIQIWQVLFASNIPAANINKLMTQDPPRSIFFLRVRRHLLFGSDIWHLYCKYSGQIIRTSLWPHWIHVERIAKSSPNGRKIQVSEMGSGRNDKMWGFNSVKYSI
jgi:hypothetical protein